jgi:hypothetical protein
MRSRGALVLLLLALPLSASGQQRVWIPAYQPSQGENIIPAHWGNVAEQRLAEYCNCVNGGSSNCGTPYPYPVTQQEGSRFPGGIFGDAIKIGENVRKQQQLQLQDEEDQLRLRLLEEQVKAAELETAERQARLDSRRLRRAAEPGKDSGDSQLVPARHKANLDWLGSLTLDDGSQVKVADLDFKKVKAWLVTDDLEVVKGMVINRTKREVALLRKDS